MAKAYLEPDEVTKLEMAAGNLRDKLLVRVLFHLGCRVSEALAIEVKDVDFTRGAVIIQHLKTRLNLSCPQCGARLGRRHAYCPGCGLKVEEAFTEEKERRRVRTLPLDKDTLEMLRDYIKRGGPIERNGKNLVFHINRHRAWQIISNLADKSNLPRLVNPETGKVHNISPHKLRDAFAVHAMKVDDSGDGLRLLQQHLGHQNFNTTARYRKVSGEEQQEWYRRLWKEEKA